MGLSRDRLATEEEVLEYQKNNYHGKGLSCELSPNEKAYQKLSIEQHKVDNVNHPPHYNSSEARCTCGRQIECIDVTRHLSFNIGNAMKYLWRCDLKGASLEDLKKAAWYIHDEINNRSKI